MSDNYPAGAANDPKAPWNQPDPVFVECEDCDGSGISETECDNEECNGQDCSCGMGIQKECSACNGTGEIESEDED